MNGKIIFENDIFFIKEYPTAFNHGYGNNNSRFALWEKNQPEPIYVVSEKYAKYLIELHEKFDYLQLKVTKMEKQRTINSYLRVES